jgi:carnitine O-acetyltransferase
MAVRKFKMPTSLNESIASSAPPQAGTGTSSATEIEPQKPKIQQGVTYAGQEKLPKLPIPDLEKTCKNYIDVLRPLQSHREHRDTIAAVEEFLKKDGPILQERLKKYATGKSSYIEQFCTYFIGSKSSSLGGFPADSLIKGTTPT